MTPRIHVVTLAVADLERALRFYRDGLGLPTKGVVATDLVGDADNAAGAVVMFHLEGGLVLALYPRTELAKDAKVPLARERPREAASFSIGHIVSTRAEVDAVLASAEAAGGTLTGAAHTRPWGIYSGYFRDLDGHLWEVITQSPS